MKSLHEFIKESTQIFELRDETYLAAAAKRRQQGRDASELLKHSSNIQVKSLIKDMMQFDWFDKYVLVDKLKVHDQCSVYIEFTENMHMNHKDYNKSEFIRIENDITNLCKKYGKLVHGVRFYIHYINEAPSAVISFLDRSNPLNVKKTATLFHVTTSKDAVDNIIKTGLRPQEKNNFSAYTYSCVFALTNKAGIKEYVKLLKDAKTSGYYVISFKAGDNIYFDDKLQNRHFSVTSNSWRDWSGTAAFTLTDISADQIVSIDYYKNNKLVETIYTKN